MDFQKLIGIWETLVAKMVLVKPEARVNFIYTVTEQRLASASIRRMIVSIGSVHWLLVLPDLTKTGYLRIATRTMH
jgi:hypothetical protein